MTKASARAQAQRGRSELRRCLSTGEAVAGSNRLRSKKTKLVRSSYTRTGSI